MLMHLNLKSKGTCRGLRRQEFFGYFQLHIGSLSFFRRPRKESWAGPAPSNSPVFSTENLHLETETLDRGPVHGTLAHVAEEAQRFLPRGRGATQSDMRCWGWLH